MTGSLDHDGYTILTGLLEREAVDQLLRDLERLRTTPAEERPAGERAEAGTRHLHRLDERSEVVASLLDHPALTSVAHTHLGSSVAASQVSARTPQPGFGGQRLHTDDVARSPGQAPTTLTAIVALCAIDDRNGGTRVIPGSHRRPDLQRRAGGLEHHPDEFVVRLDAGDALVFDGHLLHSGTPNASDADRPALQIVWRIERGEGVR